MSLKNIKMSAVFFILFLLSSTLFSQTTAADFQTFKSSRFKLYSYGTLEQATTISPNIISFNLNDSAITFQADHPAINEFVRYQNEFQIIHSFGSGLTTRVFITSSEFIFTFDSRMRVIVVSMKDINPKLHSVWFEEVSF